MSSTFFQGGLSPLRPPWLRVWLWLRWAPKKVTFTKSYGKPCVYTHNETSTWSWTFHDIIFALVSKTYQSCRNTNSEWKTNTIFLIFKCSGILIKQTCSAFLVFAYNRSNFEWVLLGNVNKFSRLLRRIFCDRVTYSTSHQQTISSQIWLLKPRF